MDPPTFWESISDAFIWDGYSKTAQNYSLYEPPESPLLLSIARCQRQFLKKEDGWWKVVLEEKLIGDAEPYQIPDFEETIWSDAQANEWIEGFFDQCRSYRNNLIVVDDADHDFRDRLALPSPLRTSARLATLDLSGINESSIFISEGKTVSTLQKKDMDLLSANILHRGSPQIWIIIPARESSKLEACLSELTPLSYTCDQFVRHQNILIDPRRLRLWEIQYSIVTQNPGDLIVTDHCAYHQTFNTGFSVAEAVNGCESTWRPPISYLPCHGPSTTEIEPCYNGQEHVIHLVQTMFSESTLERPVDLAIRPSANLAGETQVEPVTGPRRKRRRRRKTTIRPSPGQDISAAQVQPPRSSIEYLEIAGDDDDSNDHNERSSNKPFVADDMCIMLTEHDAQRRLESLISEAIESSQKVLGISLQEAQSSFLRYNSDVSRPDQAYLNDTAVDVTMDMLTSATTTYLASSASNYGSPPQNWALGYLELEEVDHVLLPRCYNRHWELVVISPKAQRIRLYGHASEDFEKWVDNFNVTTISTMRTEVLAPRFPQQNSIDCALVMFAQAEVLINDEAGATIPQGSLARRCYYLARVVRWLRTRQLKPEAFLPLLKTSESQTADLYSPFVGSITIVEGRFDFASPEVFASIASFRRAQLRSLAPPPSTLYAALQLLASAHIQQTQSHWYVTLAHVILWHEFQARRRTINERHRRECLRRKRMKYNGEEAPRAHTRWASTVAYEEILAELGASSNIREQDLKGRIQAGKIMSRLFDVVGDGMQYPLWMLASEQEAQRISGLQDFGTFEKYLVHHRPRLLDRRYAICTGLRVVLGFEVGHLKIDYMEPLQLLQEEQDSDLLLTSLEAVNQ
ncbi:hypothetical protein LTS08_008751 [Lithohypha guttulata]|nr:hypothetical protein LTS08_008751 [Lithohypha guttulata]